MINLILRRLLIFIALLTVLIGLDTISGKSLLLTLPTEFDVFNALLQKRIQKEAILEARNEYLTAQYIAILEQRSIEDDEQKKAEQAIKNAYTLGDRDKPKDYQNLFDYSIKHTFIVHFTGEEWQGMIDDMQHYHDLFGSYRSNNYRKVDVTYITDSETIEIKDVGIRSKGNIFSRYLPIDDYGNIIPIHYMMKFNETFDTVPGTQEYDWLKKREVFDLEKLHFKWNKIEDPTYINELFCYEVFDQADVVIPEINMTLFVIEIDGVIELEELYSVQEVIDEEFVRKKLQEIPTKELGDLYKVVWPGTLEPITTSDWYGVRNWETNYRPTYGKETNQNIDNFSNLIDFSFGLNIEDLTDRYAYINNYLDIDMLLRATAVNVLLGNPDDYRGNGNNYYLYLDENNFVTYIPFDYDNSMGVGWNGAPVFIDYTLGNDIYTWQGNGFNQDTDEAPLVENILDYEEYRIQYEDYLEQFIIEENFSYKTYSDLFDTFYSIYGNQFEMSNDKFYYITTKIENVLDDIQYYRNQRNN